MAVACAWAQPYAYVANVGGNNITIVNTATDTSAGTISVPGSPSGVAVTPDGSTVYVACQGANNVAVINASTKTVVANIGVGTTPIALAVNPAGTQVYVVNRGSNSVSVIDTSSKSVVGTIGVGSRPLSVAFSTDNTRAYVANLWSATVSIIDTASRTVVGSFGTPAGPNALSVAPNGHLYVSNGNAGTITVHDSSGNLLSTISGFTSPDGLAVSAAGRLVVANGNGGSATIADTAANSLLTTLTTGSIPTSVAITPDGTKAYVTNEYSLSLSVINLGTNALIKTMAYIGAYPIAVGIQPPPPGTSLPSLPPPCSYSLTSSSVSVGAGSTTGSATINTGTGCSWSSSTDQPSWLTVTSGFTGTGSGSVGYSVSNNGATTSRTGHLTIGGQQFTVTQAGTGFTAIRVNCGGPQVTDSAGNVFAADNAPNYSVTNAAIAGATSPALYQSDAWSTGTLQYQFSVPNGSFTVRLKFAEFYLTSAGQRVFNIVVNGTTYYANFDILAAGHAGAMNTAYDVSIPVTVSGGQITIQLVPVVGTPKVNGIEIF